MKKFYLGLDIGTDSVGIACSDEQYQLLRAKGKDLWAVRLFDEANDAKQRRTFRTARRRIARRKERILLLQEIFVPFVGDETFFLRLKNSAFYEEDKAEGLPRLTLFADANYTDKQFYAEYPTIFHLRQSLLEKGAKDIRLYYLALHHIIKYRGHFLFEGEALSGARDLSVLFGEFNAVSEEFFEESVRLDPALADKFMEIALGNARMNDKKREMQALLGAAPVMKEIAVFLLGGKGKPSVLVEDCEEKSFSLDIPDEEFEAMAETLGDAFPLFESMRKIFRFVRFQKILNGRETFSQSMIDIYDKHRSDLRRLKTLLAGYYPHELYVKVFKSTQEVNNYVNYIGYTKPNKKKINVKKCKSYDDFSKWLQKELSEAPASEEGRALWEEVIAELKDGTFLPKILNADCGVVPHQINLSELDLILTNLCRDFPAFGEKDGDGLTPAQKIRSLFLFRIPYFVGPLNRHGQNSWLIRKEEGRILPWNFEEKVDLEKSNEGFIRRMTGTCSYLSHEDVLPKCSIYYQAFDVLNQLNKLRINGEPISVALKQELFHSLFLTDPRVTDRKIVTYLKTHGYVSGDGQVILTGKDGDFKAGMRSYIRLKEKLGALVDERPEICEDIILWHTLCTDKGMVESYLLKKYADIPAVKENIKWIKGLTLFKDFGRLSKRFLCGISGGEDPATQQPYTILGELYRTNFNLNELLFGEKYSFREAIRAENGSGENKVDYHDVEALYVAPQVRRGIWQALEMVDEYVAALGRTPDKIFVEVTRENAPKKKNVRTVSRREQLFALLGTVKDIQELKEELGKKSDSDLRQERLYLYFRQLGRCMYTGQKIDLARLNTDLYDVDHILPRSLVKDDSLENKVLVLRTKNKEKSDIYPLPMGFTDQKPFWKVLHEKKLIGDKKWASLTRTEPLTEKDFEDFVNRQLVYTNQMAKAVAELLARKFEKDGTKIVFSKAGRVSDFRQKFDFVKCRDTNDLHHARDAYLNIVVGNVYDTRFSSLRDMFYRRGSDGSQREIKLDTLFTYDVAGAWDKMTSLALVRKTMGKTSMAITRYTFVNGGEFYDQTVYSKGDSGIGAPRKGKGPLSDPQKYGGYKKLNTAYFAVVLSKDKKGNAVKTIEAIPVLIDYKTKGDRAAVLSYLRETCGLIEPRLLIPRLRMKSLVKINGTPAYLAGITGSRIVLHNAVEWFTDQKTDAYVKALGKLLEDDRMGKYRAEERMQEMFIMHTNRFGEVKQTIDRAQNEALYDAMLRQLEKPVYGGISGAVFFGDKVKGLREKFFTLPVLDQAKVLMQIAKFLKCNAESSDLSLVGAEKSCGNLRINQNITEVDFRIVHQSACGLDVRERKV